MAWQAISRRLKIGTIFSSRTGKEYRIVSVDDKGYSISRTYSGTTVRISRKNVEYAYEQLQCGESIAYQATKANGGISYTVAQTVGALYPLRNVPGYALDDDAKQYVPKN